MLGLLFDKIFSLFEKLKLLKNMHVEVLIVIGITCQGFNLERDYLMDPLAQTTAV